VGGKGQGRAGIGTWKAPQPDQIIPHPAFFFFLSVLRGATSPHLTNHDAKQDLILHLHLARSLEGKEPQKHDE